MDRSEGRAPLSLGKIARVQGLRGEFRVNPLSGDPEVFLKLRALLLAADEAPVAVASARVHKNQAVVKLAGIDTIEAAQALVGRDVWVTRDMLPEAGDDEYYWVDLVGCRVQIAGGNTVGTVVRVESIGAHDNLVIERPGKDEAQVPFVDAMVVEVDIAQQLITIDPPEGLLE